MYARGKIMLHGVKSHCTREWKGGSVITTLDYILDWTTALTQTTSFRAGQKVNALNHSVW